MSQLRNHMALGALGALVAMLAACGRERAPVATMPAPAPAHTAAARPPALPVRPVWAARKVVPDGVGVAGGTTLAGPGETIDAVAARTRVPAGALAAANGLPNPRAALGPGQTLKLPTGRIHTVHPGETGIAIARAYGVDWGRVVAANRLAAPYTLEIGDRLLLPSKQVVAAMSVEERARAFRIDIDDLITGAEPAAPPEAKAAARSVATARTPMPAKGSARATPLPAVASAAVAASKPLPLLTGPAPKFDWPLDGRVLSGFGAKPGGRFNDGVNLAAGSGDAVRAAGDGVVAYAGDAVAGFGNLVLIKHADGWVSAYGHNATLLVARGAHVAKGEVIARAGATGAVSEPQLHFELRHGRTAVDPAKLLPVRG